MVTTSHQKLSAGTYEIVITASGFERYVARIRISSSGSMSCVSVSGGSCSSRATPGMTISGRTVSTRMKSTVEKCVRDSDCDSGYKCFSGVCQKLTGCTTTPDFSYSVSGKTLSFRDTSTSSGSGCSIVRRLWNLGSGLASENTTCSRTFPSYNTSYPIILTVTDSAGNKKSKSKTVRTGSASGGGGTTCSTTAKFTYRVSGKTIYFTDTSTSSGSGCSIVRRLWNLGSGRASENRTCSRTFPSYNTSYPIILTVTDSKGNKKSTSKTVRTGSASGGGGGVHVTTMEESKELSQGADHIIRVSHDDYEMLSMKIRISSSGSVSCVSVEGGSCNSTTPPGIKISGTTITTYMKEGEGGVPGVGGVCDYILSIGGKASIDWTRDVLGSYYKYIGSSSGIAYDPDWNDVLTMYYYYIGSDSSAESLTHCGL